MTSPNNSDDLTDLAEARRIIAALRTELRELHEQREPLPGEYTIFLDDKHARMLELLFQRQKLFEEQDQSWELSDAVTQFVQDSLGIQWDITHMMEDYVRAAKTKGAVAPSA